jgi:peroxiredoxin
MGFTLAAGAQAPDFDLPGHDGRNHSFKSVKGAKGTLVFFTCNHCPYVVGSEERMVSLFGKAKALGISMVGIHSNETKDHPTDDFDHVKRRMREMGFGWLSLRDESQLVARAYGAERTPHYFLFDADDRLVYSGRMDNSPRDASKAETHELEDAIADMLAGRPARLDRTDAIGCSVKWWDREKHWMPADACDLDYLYQRDPKSDRAQGQT